MAKICHLAKKVHQKNIGFNNSDLKCLLWYALVGLYQELYRHQVFSKRENLVYKKVKDGNPSTRKANKSMITRVTKEHNNHEP